MSSLDKLAIRGIRSFDHQDLEVIQFYTPLTLIVGQNGSGKTTIIECLKYATTGDLPPNAKGGAFVHDPGIAGTSEVKAQVKLRFFSTRRERMLVERRLQVSRRKTATGTGLTTKTLEGVISHVDDARDGTKRTSLSTKCVSLDEEVPRQLGVSRAILENVIFCHQEDANWPLAEPAALKRRFDDIFDATRYAKALDELKKMRKDLAVEAKVDTERVSALRTDRDRALRLRLAVDRVRSEVGAKEAQLERVSAEAAAATAENRTFHTRGTRFQEILGRIETLRTQRRIYEENMQQIERDTEILADSDAELTEKIDKYQSESAAADGTRADLRANIKEAEFRLADIEKRRSSAQLQHGQLLSEKRRHADACEEREALIRRLAVEFGISREHENAEGDALAFSEQLQRITQEHRTQLAELNATSHSTQEEKRREIQKLNNEKAARENEKRSLLSQIKSARHNIATMNRNAERIAVSVADLSFKESALRAEQARREELEAVFKTADHMQQIMRNTQHIKDLEEKREALHSELLSLNAQADVRAKLQLKRVDLGRKKDAAEALIVQIKGLPSLSKVMGGETAAEISAPALEKAVEKNEAQLEDSVSAAERDEAKINKELSSVETSHRLSNARLEKLKAIAADHAEKIRQGLKNLDTDAKSVKDALKEAQEEVKLVRQEMGDAQGVVQFFNTLLNTGKKEHTCKGCNRALSDTELASFERYVTRQIERAPERMKDLQEEVASWEAQLRTLQNDLLPLENEVERLLKSDIPAAEQEASQLSAQLSEMQPAAEAAAARISDLKLELGELTKLKRLSVELGRLQHENSDIASDIARLERELAVTGSTTTSDEIQAQISTIADDIRIANTAVDKLRSDMNMQSNKIQLLVASIHESEMELEKSRHELKEKENIEKSKQELSTKVTDWVTDQERQDREIDEIERKITMQEEQLQQLRVSFEEKEQGLRHKLESYSRGVEQLGSITKELERYPGDAKLAECEECISQLDASVQTVKTDLERLHNELSAVERQLVNSTATMRNFNDNLRYRREKKEVDRIDAEIDALDEKGTKKAAEEFDASYEKLRKNEVDLQSEQAGLASHISALQEDIKSKEKELKEDYKDIDNKFKTELIKLKTTEMANQDLEKYYRALDAAIMAFHGYKMKEINDTIADLWTKTYQGTDIDRIMLKSDAEGKVNGRSYNYRVVMLKDSIEMDMRGRCSAGQKVLASIIIRLALAESFAANCGVLALDEPTTNLDKSNIDALAEALAELIKERRAQANFQLIIITHDEGFLSSLGASGVVDKYWMVKRSDANGQVSHVERVTL